ncbi:MAG: amidohydrolase family protein [Ktedonobacterales bacterium]|nr:amidohydrolase family protein [Ktedonobacterales bacterium]
MIIDMHTHIFPPEVIANRAHFAARDPWFAELYGDPQARMATAEDVVASLTAHGIDRAVTFGFGWRDAGLIRLANDYVIDAVRRHPDRLIGFAVIQPTAPADALAEITRAYAAGLRGIGELMPHGQGYRLSDTTLLAPIAEAAQALDLIVLTHASEPVGHHYPGKGDVSPADLLAFAAAFPQLRVVAAHWGGGLPFYHLMPEVAELLRHWWFDTAASPFLYTPAVWRAAALCVGSDKILWASDYPLIRHPRMLRYLAAGGLTPEESAQVLGGNAAHVLGLDG